MTIFRKLFGGPRKTQPIEVAKKPLPRDDVVGSQALVEKPPRLTAAPPAVPPRSVATAPATSPPTPTVPAGPPSVDRPQAWELTEDHAFEAAVEAALKGDWATVETYLAGIESPERRDFAISWLGGRLTGYPAGLDDWVDARPGAYLPILFRGDYKVRWAWQARGGTDSRARSRQAVDTFKERLGLAKTDLEIAAELAPTGDAGACVSMLNLAIGLEYDKRSLRMIFEEAQQRWPWHELATMRMIQALTPKWGGSLEAMFDVARRALAESPEGSGAHLALVSAHCESSAAEGTVAYWRVPGVLDDVLQAAEGSIDSPAYVPSIRTNIHHNHFLYAFGRLRQWDRFELELALVDGRLDSPFTDWTDPTMPYREMRNELASARSSSAERHL